MLQESNRLKRLPPYLFTILNDLKKRAKEEGKDIIDLGMGNPDLPTPKHIVDSLISAVKEPWTHRYPGSTIGLIELREAMSNWYLDRFKVKLDPETEVLPLIGAKEGIAHLALSFLNSDDIALVPSPAYPVHSNSVIIAGGILYNIPMTKEHNFIPNLKTLDKEIVRMAKLLFISYPHNPTTAVADIGFFNEVVEFAKREDILIAHDLAYSDIVFDGYKAPSILEVEGAKDIAVEFHTLSKSYNMAGWRIGYVVGNAEILRVLAKTKGYMDFGIFQAVQKAAITALSGPQDCVNQLVGVYQKRRDVLVNGLNKIGWNIDKPKATMYVWTHLPLKFQSLPSLEFAKLLMEETGVVVSPGMGFGEYGEGYIRFSLVEKEKRLEEAVDRIKRFLEMRG